MYIIRIKREGRYIPGTLLLMFLNVKTTDPTFLPNKPHGLCYVRMAPNGSLIYITACLHLELLELLTYPEVSK